jgi:hypothetical protein
MVDSIGLNKINAIPKTKPLAHKKTEKPKRDSEKNEKHSNNEAEEQKRIGINIDEQC